MLDCHWDVHELDATPPDSAASHAIGERRERTTLVGAVVVSTAPTARRVRVRSRLDGPVLPPRRRGVPEGGWTEDGFEGVVPADGRLALGFAAAGSPTDPPVTVEDGGRAAADDAADEDPSPTALLRELGSPAPPRDAVPAPGDAAVGEPTRDGRGDGSRP